MSWKKNGAPAGGTPEFVKLIVTVEAALLRFKTEIA
jgi:hypothetical protein